MKKTLLLATMSLGALTLVGCNTVRGAGQDLQNAGQAIRHAATSKTDKTVTRQIVYRLNHRRSLKNQSICVTTVRGTVTLSGHVDHDWQRRDAMNTTYQVKGVRKVVDHIIVRH